MEFKMFTIWDCKSDCYMQPFCVTTKGEAIRAIANLVNDPKHNFNKYSADFTLFQIGEYDNLTGRIKQFDAFINEGNLVEFKELTPQ